MDQDKACTVEEKIACIENIKDVPAEAATSAPISPQKSEDLVQFLDVGHTDFDKDEIGFETMKAKPTISPLPSPQKSKRPVESLKVLHEQNGKDGVSFEIITAEAKTFLPTSSQKSEEPVEILEVGHDDVDKDGIVLKTMKAKTIISPPSSPQNSERRVGISNVRHEQTGRDEVGFEFITTEAKKSLTSSSQKPEESVENLEICHEQTGRDGVGFDIIIAEATAVPCAPKRLLQSGKQLSANEIKQKMSIADGRRRCLIDVIREKAQKSNLQVKLVVQRKDERNLNFLNRLQHKSTMRAQECADRRSYYLRNNLGKLRSDAPAEQHSMKMQLKDDVMQTYRKEQKCDKKNNSKTEHGASVSDHKSEVINLKEACAFPGSIEKSSGSEDLSDNVEKKSGDSETEETETSTERLVGDIQGDKGRSVY